MTFSIVTATVGRITLLRTVSSVSDAMRRAALQYEHILVWDDRRETMSPDNFAGYPNLVHLVARGTTIAGMAKMGLGWCASKNEWAMSLDDDCWIEDPLAYSKIAGLVHDRESRWGFCRRVLYDRAGQRIGPDVYESIGNEPQTTEYRGETFCDMNTMFLRRDVAMFVAPYMCFTGEYSGDRNVYRHLMARHGPPASTKDALIAYTIRDKLVPTAKRFCQP